jgi:hypothetical protein
MFKFKKSMAGVPGQENFECECCGSTEEQASAAGSGCAPGCGSAYNSCCDPAVNPCCADTPEEASTWSGCCTQSNNSCCG